MTSKSELRRKKIENEIVELQQKLIGRGHKIGQPLTFEEIERLPECEREWIARIWYLGRALNRADIPIFVIRGCVNVQNQGSD